MAKNKNITLPLALAVRVELFRRGRFDFITSRDGKNHDKQQQALSIVTHSDHVEILYGGAAGGAIECAELLKAQGYITKK